jgi:hypothetical protein
MATAKKATTAKAGEEKTVELTVSQLEGLVDGAVKKALEAAPAPAPAAPPAPQRMTNADFIHMGSNPLRQTQEDVTMTALTVGPASHGGEFMPCVPEYVATKDRDDHRPLINEIEALGYVVELHGVEFQARFEPTDEDKVLLKDAKEPPEAAPLIQRLQKSEPLNSRVWLQKWFDGKPVSGERTIDEMVADVKHGSPAEAISAVQSQMATGVETFSHLDNLGTEAGIEIGQSDLSRIDSVKI